MSIQSRINHINKRVENITNKLNYRTVLIVKKEDDDKNYDFWDWKEKGQLNEVNRAKYEAMGGTTIFVVIAYLDSDGKGSGGFIPDTLKREDFA